MKKLCIAAAMMLGLGIIGTAATLPAVIKEQTVIFNEAVNLGDEYYEETLPENIKVLELNNKIYSGYHTVYVRQSKDNQVHVKTHKTGNIEDLYTDITTNGDTAVLTIEYRKVPDWKLNRENVLRMINDDLRYQDEIILEVPETITIHTDFLENAGLQVMNAKFVNLEDYEEARNIRERYEETIHNLYDELEEKDMQHQNELQQLIEENNRLNMELENKVIYNIVPADEEDFKEPCQVEVLELVPGQSGNILAERYALERKWEGCRAEITAVASQIADIEREIDSTTDHVIKIQLYDTLGQLEEQVNGLNQKIIQIEQELLALNN